MYYYLMRTKWTHYYLLGGEGGDGGDGDRTTSTIRKREALCVHGGGCMKFTEKAKRFGSAWFAIIIIIMMHETHSLQAHL